ncbi:retron system putative HNH endonuclease [Pseudomonas putida]
MRQVFKGTEPDSLIQWKAMANEEWSPSYPALQNPEKRCLHKSLLQEQGYLCCYCGYAIDLGSSHIEHFRPQELYEPLALDYANLHASCLRQTAPGNPMYCGHHKGNWFDETLHISPLQEGCEQRFRYSLNGEITAASPTDASAAKMIDILALDIAFLRNRRKETLAGIFDDQFLIDATPEELKQLISLCRRPGHARSLGHVMARYAEQLL